EISQGLAIVALVEEKASLVLGARSDTKTDAVLGYNSRWGWLGRPAVEGFLLLDMLFSKRVKTALRIMLPQDVLYCVAKAEHAGSEELHHQRCTEAVDD